MEAIDLSFKESCSIFVALSMSSSVLRLTGSKIGRLDQSWSYDFFDDLGIGSRGTVIGTDRRKQKGYIYRLALIEGAKDPLIETISKLCARGLPCLPWIGGISVYVSSWRAFVAHFTTEWAEECVVPTPI